MASRINTHAEIHKRNSETVFRMVGKSGISDPEP